jgi:sugar lactone lactonase YvrE
MAARKRQPSFALVACLLASVVVGAVAGAAAGLPGISGSDRITTIAGNGKAGFSGDGGPATSGQLGGPTGLAVNAQANVYIADTTNNRVRRVTPAGTITTIAGANTAALGDGGPATSARLRSPVGLAIDRQGSLYIAEANDARVRKVSPDGTITTIAGTGARGSSGDGGPATSAKLYFPRGVAVDAQGSVYISDYELQTVRKVNPAGTITTFAGTGRGGFSGDGGPATSAQLRYPEGIAVDGSGNVYIADRGNGRVRKVSPAGTITTIAGGGASLGDGGAATSARLSNPEGLAVDAQGNVYIADWGHYLVLKVSGGTITTIAGTGAPACGPFTIGAAIGDGGPATSAPVCQPWGLALDGQGNLYVAEQGRSRVRKVTAAPSAPSGGSSAATTTAARTIETVLTQMASGRATLRDALGRASRCSMSPRAAATRVAAVAASRRHALARLARLSTPTTLTARIKSRLQVALSHSIAADQHYRDWLAHQQGRCATTRTADLSAAARADRAATTAKRAFLAAFNPLARKLHLRTWSADQI